MTTNATIAALLGPRPLTLDPAAELTEGIRRMFARYLVRALAEGGLVGDAALPAARPMLDYAMAHWAPSLVSATATLIAAARTVAAHQGVPHGTR